ncbi:MAG: hypothetical protein WEC80_00990 [Patescibacteria group bacterium]
MNEISNDRPPGKLKKKAIAFTTAAALTMGGIAVGQLKNHYDQPHGTPYQTHSLHESAGVNHWEEQIKNQLRPGGEIQLADIEIDVQNGILNGRYTPTVKNTGDGVVGNIAVEFKPGAHFNIENAVVIKGDNVDPNDPNGDLWAWVDGDHLGLQKDVFLSLSGQTANHITQSRKIVTFAGFNDQGDVRYSDSTGTKIATRDIVPAQPPTATNK